MVIRRADPRATLYWLMGLSLSLLVASCSPSRPNKIATESVEQFRAAWRSSNYQQIYLRSDQAFKERVTEEDFRAFAITMKDKLGEVQASELTEDHVTYTITGIVVVLIYQTEFTNGKASEQFVWMIKGNQSSLYNYTLNLQIPYNRK